MQRRGGIKETRETSSEFDRVIALTSETVTRGVSFLTRTRLPEGHVFNQAVSSFIFSCRLSSGPNWVTFTKVYSSLVSLCVWI